MKILLLIISLMICNTRAMYKTKAIHKTLNTSIRLLQNISNKFNTTLYFNMTDFQNIQNIVYLTGEMSKKHLKVCFSSINNLDQLNNFNKEIVHLDNVKTHFINIVISLIGQIFKSLPEEDVEVSSESNDIFSYLMRNLINQQDKNKIIIYVKHIYGSTDIIFHCLLKEEPKTIIVPSLNPNEKEEENESKPLLEKKQK